MNAENSVRFVNKSQLACMLNKSRFTIDDWIRKGMPVYKKGHQTEEWQFDVSEILKWREDHAAAKSGYKIENVAVQDLKKRKLVAEIEILEDDLQKRRREVVKIAEAEQVMTHVCITVKQRLRTIPERIRTLLASENDEIACGELLMNEIDDALLELSQLDFNGIKPQ